MLVYIDDRDDTEFDDEYENEESDSAYGYDYGYEKPSYDYAEDSSQNEENYFDWSNT